MILKRAHEEKARIPTDRKVVKLGMTNYLLPRSCTETFKPDESHCEKKFQVISFETLAEKITFAIGYPVDIVDAGSGPQLGVFDPRGSFCVPQALYTSIVHSGALSSKTLKKLAKLDNTQKAGVLSGHPEVQANISLLMKIAT